MLETAAMKRKIDKAFVNLHWTLNQNVIDFKQVKQIGWFIIKCGLIRKQSDREVR